MAEELYDQVIRRINEASLLYHQLVLIVAPSGKGKTVALRNVASQTGLPYINVNLELSQHLLEVPQRQRSTTVPQLLDGIIRKHGDKGVVLDNLEVLFHPALQLDPLRLLQQISRNRMVVATWNGSVENNFLTYAAPDHPEYRRYADLDILVIKP